MRIRKQLLLVVVIVVVIAASSLITSSFLAAKTQRPNGCFDIDVSQIVNKQVAVVIPYFTASAYQDQGFYDFYSKHAKDHGNITMDLEMLNVTVDRNWAQSYQLISFLLSDLAKSCGLSFGRNLQLVPDTELSSNPMILKGLDVVILGFEEYATITEFRALEVFTHAGGTLIILGSSMFNVEVGTNLRYVWLMHGHGWSFNGRSAWPDPRYRYFRNDTTNWLGAVYCCRAEILPNGTKTETFWATPDPSNQFGGRLKAYFGLKILASYRPHEEDLMTNTTDIPIAISIIQPNLATFLHPFGKGRVFYYGIQAVDIIAHDQSAQYLLLLAIETHHRPNA